MSRQPKLRPKSHIPGYSDALYDLGVVAPIAEMENRPFGEERREQRVFRVKRKHVLKACDRCRVKKTKCDGKQPCNRCSAYNHPCLFRERKAAQTKVYSRGFVEMLESHHSLVVKALQKLYKHCINKEPFPGEPLVETADGHPLTHAILDRLGLIKQAEENPEEPDEDSEDLQYLRVLSTSTDSSATSDPSPEPATPPGPIAMSLSMSMSGDPSGLSFPTQGTSGGAVGNGGNGGESWRWEYHPEQYHAHTNAQMGYPETNYNEMAFSQPSLRSTSLSDETNISPPQLPPSQPDHSYLYYLDHGGSDRSMKSRFQPAASHQHHHSATGTGLPVEMLPEYHLPLQDQSLYGGISASWGYCP